MTEKPCDCGCGGIVTEVYPHTDRRNGQERGQLKRFLPSHQFNLCRGRRWAEYTAQKESDLKGQKKCGMCKQTKPLENFYQSSVGLYKRGGYCTACVKKLNSEWYAANPEWRKKKNASLYRRAKDKVFDHYGRQCKCCKEKEPMFLSIDHINNDGGGRYRKDSGYAMYRNIANIGFPSTFQVLCWNCNVGKQRNGGVCPHLKDKR